MDSIPLRRIVREKLQRGLLPSSAPLHETQTTERAREPARACAACGTPLVPGDPVYELQTGPASLTLHATCHSVWRSERVVALTEALTPRPSVDVAGAAVAPLSDISYVVDLDDRLVACSRESWQRFAVANDGPEIAEPDRLLQQSVFDFIRGDATRMLYLTIHQRLQSHPEARVVLTGRCDAPATRRTWRISIVALSEGGRVTGIVYRSTVLDEVARREVTLLRRTRPSAGPGSLVMCTLCLRVSRETMEAWTEIERYALDHPEGRDLVADYAVCSSCDRDVVRPALGAI